MIRLLGLVFLVVGAVLLYYGWQSHEAAGAGVFSAPAEGGGARSLWLLGLGAVAAVWGLFALLRRNVL